MATDVQENSMKEDQNILKEEQEAQNLFAFEKAQNIVNYFAMVNRAKKELKKTHPEIPEKDLDLYL